MLKKIGNTKVVSSDGREIKIQFQWDYIVYKESKCALYVGISRKTVQNGILICIDFNDSFSDWLPPYAGDPLPLSKKVEIINFIEECLALLEYEYAVSNKPGCKK